MSLIDLKSLSEKEISYLIREFNEPEFRTKQLIHWIYEKGVQSVSEITEFSLELRKRFSEKAFISNLILVERRFSQDGTEKFLFGLQDGKSIESVLIKEDDRLTLCVSSQVGCPLGCIFCATGKLKFERNLEPHEIVDQVITVSRLIAPKKILNIVFMGMGEPLLNFDNLVEALWRIVEYLKFSPRRITISTAGIISKFKELVEKAPSVNLAVSLNAPNDHIRDYIMPINKKYPLSQLIEACSKFSLKPRRRITFEYVMLKGINDSHVDAEELANLLRGISSKTKINLISFNPFEGCILEGSDNKTIYEFQQRLIDKNLSVFIRKSKGRDIEAGCGQLRALYGRKV